MWVSPAWPEQRQVLATNGAQDENRTHDLRIDKGLQIVNDLLR